MQNFSSKCIYFFFSLKVQFQKVQQLRLSQNRAQYYGGSLPNVNQIGNTSTDFQVPGMPSIAYLLYIC